jgi:hypothetical protein
MTKREILYRYYKERPGAISGALVALMRTLGPMVVEDIDDVDDKWGAVYIIKDGLIDWECAHD